MLEPPEIKRRNYWPRVLLLSFIIIVVVAAARQFWPVTKGFAATEKSTVVSDTGVLLNGIFYDDDDPVAIVNGKMVQQQDVIDGAKVVKIYRRKVEFEKDGKAWTLDLQGTPEGIAGAKPLMLQLGSKRCPPCRRMKPVLEYLQKNYADKFKLKYIDVEMNPAAGSQYGIRAIPTQIFYDSSGREIFRHTGFYSGNEILAVWKSHGIEL
jgi:thiol-disulfide isomerase/thioredoxin